MAEAAAQNAMALIGANLHPGGWKKVESHEENLRTFNKWFKAYGRYTNACLCGVNIDDRQKWDIFAATGGDGVYDAMEEAGIVTIQRDEEDEVQEVPHVPYRPAGANGEPPEQQEVAYVPGRPRVEAIVPTPFLEGIELIRAVIGKYSNLIMQRKILMTGMPASNYSDWKKWGQMLIQQAERCNYDDGTYNSKVAALDALLFQCLDAEWRKKILAGSMNFQQAIDYGMRHLTAKKQSEELSQAHKNGEKETLPVDRVEEKKQFDCSRCQSRHSNHKCKAYGQKCRVKGHFAGSPHCEGKPKADKGGGGGDNRGRRSQRRDSRGKQSNDNGTKTKTVFKNINGQYRKFWQTVNCVEEEILPEDESSVSNSSPYSKMVPIGT